MSFEVGSLPSDLVAEAERLFTEAAALSGQRLSDLARSEGLTAIKESPHLQRTFRMALEEVVQRANPQPQVSPSLGHGLKSEWPKLGNFDISLRWASGDVYGELKCGTSALTLSACGWDAAKCTFCLNHGVGTGMLLVAAAPRDFWSVPTIGIELLFDGEWDMADIHLRYAAGFRAWEGDGYKPDYVFRRLRTTEVSRTQFDIAAKPWLLGIARIEPIDVERMDWVPFFTPAALAKPTSR